ncbi:MAG: hypothetical protein RLZ12_681 [Bacillota bacterium]|jgi:large subunit ribosomal protein L6
MSRIGKKPIPLPTGVEVDIQPDKVVVKGPKGELSRSFYAGMIIKKEKESLIVERPNDQRLYRSLHGTTRSVLANMVTGTHQGFTKTLELVGVGYRAAKEGSNLVLNVGYSHPVKVAPETGIEFEVPSQTQVIVRGINKEQVGAVAADIRSIRKPEPYKGKGIRYQNEVVKRKEGKTGK